MAARVEVFETVDLDGALVLLAFPTAGSAASIAAYFLVEHLELPLVGHIQVPELNNVAAIQDGRATSAVRIFGGEVECNLEGDCPRIFLVTTELSIGANVGAALGRAILEWSKAGNARMALALEAVVRGEGDDTPDVYCASARPDVQEALLKVGIEPMPRAVIGGITARVLLEGAELGVKTGAIMVEATRDHPDGRAAAALIQVLDRLVPSVDMDSKPLLEEALRIEEEIAKAREPTEPERPPHPTFI